MLTKLKSGRAMKVSIAARARAGGDLARRQPQASSTSSMSAEVAKEGGEVGGDAMEDAELLVPEGEAVVYEEELLANPYSLKLWLRYLQVSVKPFLPVQGWWGDKRVIFCADQRRIVTMMLEIQWQRDYPAQPLGWRQMGSTASTRVRCRGAVGERVHMGRWV